VPGRATYRLDEALGEAAGIGCRGGGREPV